MTHEHDLLALLFPRRKNFGVFCDIRVPFLVLGLKYNINIPAQGRSRHMIVRKVTMKPCLHLRAGSQKRSTPALRVREMKQGFLSRASETEPATDPHVGEMGLTFVARVAK